MSIYIYICECEYAYIHVDRRVLGMQCRRILSLWFTSCERRVRDGVSLQSHFPTAGIRVSGCGFGARAGSLPGGAACSASPVAGI